MPVTGNIQTFRAVKSRGQFWAGLVSRMKEIRNEYRILQGKQKTKTDKE
jgi:hypothetical protein